MKRKFWLLKTEPEEWSWHDQLKIKPKGIAWDGVRNYQALNNLKKMNFKPIFPSKEFCGDNAVMIAWTGIQRYKKKLFHSKNETVRSRWPLDKEAPFLKGPGLKL